MESKNLPEVWEQTSKNYFYRTPKKIFEYHVTSLIGYLKTWPKQIGTESYQKNQWWKDSCIIYKNWGDQNCSKIFEISLEEVKSGLPGQKVQSVMRRMNLEMLSEGTGKIYKKIKGWKKKVLYRVKKERTEMPENCRDSQGSR